MKSLKSWNRRGQIIDTVTGAALGLFLFILIVFAILLGISSLNPGSFFTAGSVSQNATNDLTNNFTNGISTFAGQLPTFMKVLAVVLVLGALALLIVIVLKFRGVTSGGAAGL